MFPGFGAVVDCIHTALVQCGWMGCERVLDVSAVGCERVDVSEWMRAGFGCKRCWTFGGKTRRRDGSVAKQWRLVVAGELKFRIKKDDIKTAN